MDTSDEATGSHNPWFSVQIYPFDALNDQNLSVIRKGSGIFTIKFNFGVQKAQKRSNETAQQISNP